MMVRSTQYLMVAAALALAGCAPQESSTGTAADEEAITAIGTKYAEAWNAGDAAALAQLVTEDYANTEPDGSLIQGRAAFENMSKTEAEARKTMGLKITIVTDYKRFVGSKAALSTGKWSLEGVPPGGGPDKGSFLAVMEKGDDGTWRMASGLAASFVPPPPAPDSAAMKKGG